MKVLQINTVCGIGSTGRIAADLYQCLKDSGNTGAIAYGRGAALGCNSAIRIGSKWDVYSHAAKARLIDRNGFGSKESTRRFVEQIRKFDPDIIHLHNIHGYYLHIGELFQYLKLVNKPIVWTLHDCWAFTGHCTYFEYLNCNRWKTCCYHCPQKKTYPSRWLLDSSSRNYKDKKELFTGILNLTLVTPSKWLADQVKQSFLSDYPVQVIPNGIDLKVFRPSESGFRECYGIRSEEFLVLAVASIWEERKGLPCFMELAKKLNRECRFAVVGVNDKQIRELPHGVIGISRTESAAELAQIYSAADVFVNTTLEDNFPTTNLESLACGTPVITFRTGGSVESVDENTGIIVEKGNLTELAEAVRTVKKNQKSAYNDACVLKAKEKYEKNITYADYMKLYQSLL